VRSESGGFERIAVLPAVILPNARLASVDAETQTVSTVIGKLCPEEQDQDDPVMARFAFAGLAAARCSVQTRGIRHLRPCGYSGRALALKVRGAKHDYRV
jgi:hypothetical protein